MPWHGEAGTWEQGWQWGGGIHQCQKGSFSLVPHNHCLTPCGLRVLQCSARHSRLAVCESYQYFMERLPPGEGSLSSAQPLCCSDLHLPSCTEHPISSSHPAAHPLPQGFPPCLHAGCSPAVQLNLRSTQGKLYKGFRGISARSWPAFPLWD